MSKSIAQAVSTPREEGALIGEFSDPLDCSSCSETLQAMCDAAQGRNLFGPFDTTEETWAAILEDDGE